MSIRLTTVECEVSTSSTAGIKVIDEVGKAATLSGGEVGKAATLSQERESGSGAG
jgi:hypothetical protein